MPQFQAVQALELVQCLAPREVRGELLLSIPVQALVWSLRVAVWAKRFSQALAGVLVQFLSSVLVH